ncbi:MAG TPA: hypothetical protein VNW97_02010 [Candidatus Saccharimonadales bacterium]|jgi:hypothetical protein|nr:hypothetical protein [Candidatus Saccharimonadales bacterium]
MKNLLKVAVVSSLVFFIVSCGGGSKSNPVPPPPPPPPPVPLSVCLPPDAKGNVACPAAQSVNIGASQQFNATLQGTPATVTWSVNGVTGGNAATGTITSNGLYTAPTPFPTPNTFTLTATLQSDSTRTGSLALSVVFANNNAQMETAPIQLGTSGGNATDVTLVTGGRECCSGTLGSVISRGGVDYILSNNHVLAKSDKGTTGPTGDIITQPGLVDNSCNPGANMVAHLTEFAPLKPATSPGPAPKNVDAAIGQIVAGTVDATGAILDLGAASGTAIAAAPPSNVALAPPAIGLPVAKVGRSTSLTCGSITSINNTVSVAYDANCGGAVAFTSTFSNQIFISGNFSASGDSGSLVVSSAQARPVGLLFAGTTSPAGTIANPISDVIAAFTTAAGVPSIKGGADHAVSCAPSGSVNAPTAAPGTANLSRRELDRATGILNRFAGQLTQDPAVTGVEVGASADNPAEAALLVHVDRVPSQPVPVEIEGLRTRLVLPAWAAQQAHLTAGDVERTTAIKELHVDELMSQPGIQGVGVAISDDNPLEPAVVIFTILGEQHLPVPPTLNGIRTKVIESDRIRAFGWGQETVRPAACTGRVSAPVKGLGRP